LQIQHKKEVDKLVKAKQELNLALEKRKENQTLLDQNYISLKGEQQK